MYKDEYNSVQFHLRKGKFLLLTQLLPYNQRKQENNALAIPQDLHYFDIICVGNFRAIAAERIVKRRSQKYKIGVINFKRKIKQLAPSGIGSEWIAVTNQPKGVDIIEGSLNKIVPAQRIVILDNTKRLLYKFLIYGQQNWEPNMHQHPLAEALKCEYSRVFFDLQNYDQLIKDKGNIVFYVPEGPSKFKECYPFLRIAQQLQNKKDNHLIILLQGNSFFPHCKEAHSFIEQQLNNYGVQIIYNVSNIRVDYLRRIFYYKEGKQQKRLIYSSVFCFIADQVPKLLTDSGIDPFACNHQLLHNTQFDSIYVVGADNLPTTKTFHASALQLHYSVQNILQRLKPKKFHNKSTLCAYNGDTKFKIALSNQQSAEIQHSHSHNPCEIYGTGCIRSMLSKYIDSYLLRQFCNFNNYGPPHYLWLPALQQSSKMEQLTENKQNDQQMSVFKSY